MDLLRAGMALVLPFVSEVWQVYVMIFLLQSASAAFTPTFQATIPDVLPEERHYTRALSLSRLAYDLESLLSPTLAALLLSLFSFHWLFGGTAICFLASAALVLSVRLPSPATVDRGGGIFARVSRGTPIYLATPRLRGLLALNLSVAAAGASLVWPARDPKVIPHSHSDLSPDHPHLHDVAGHSGHEHAFVIDDLHPRWPTTRN